MRRRSLIFIALLTVAGCAGSGQPGIDELNKDTQQWCYCYNFQGYRGVLKNPQTPCNAQYTSYDCLSDCSQGSQGSQGVCCGNGDPASMTACES